MVDCLNTNITYDVRNIYICVGLGLSICAPNVLSKHHLWYGIYEENIFINTYTHRIGLGIPFAMKYTFLFFFSFLSQHNHFFFFYFFF